VPVKQTRDSSADALEKELLIRPLGTVLYLWHPFVNSQGEMNGMPVILRDSLKEALG
jgi:adenosylmethionine-8-amino-7-oxononanoate aminotransferase